MHVLYLIDSLAPGGAERSLAAMAPHLRRLGVDLEVAYLYDRPGVGPDLEAAHATLHSLAGAGGRVGNAARASRLVRQVRPDLVHTTLFEADLTGRFATLRSPVPVVCSLVNPAYGPTQLSNPGLRRWKVRIAHVLDAGTARRVERFHAVSASVADVMAATLRVPRDRIDVIPRGRDPEELGRRSPTRRTEARHGLGIPEAAPTIVAIGRQEHQKGFDVLLCAFARVRERYPDARLAIAGRDGGASTRLHKSIVELGLGDAIELLGSRDDVAELLCAADVFAFPSRWEGSPGSVLEAMALETPIVASDIPSVRELIPDDRCAWFVPVDDADALACALNEVLCDQHTAARTTAARSRFLDHFTVDRRAAEIVRFYERVLSPAAADR